MMASVGTGTATRQATIRAEDAQSPRLVVEPHLL